MLKKKSVHIHNGFFSNAKNYKKLFTLCLLVVPLFHNTAFAQLKVFIKLDDFGVLNNNHAANVMDTIEAIKLRVAIGIISKTLDANAGQEYSKLINATNGKGQKLIEVWFHGYDHSKGNPPNNNGEFNGTSYDFQKEHFKEGDEIVKQKLGVQMHTFGSPGNAADTNTIKVIKSIKAYKVIMLKAGEASGMRDGILYLNNEVAMESGTGVVNYAYFLEKYKAVKDKYKDFIVIQGHPNGWDAARISEFLQIVNFLKSEHVEFVLPYEYYLSIKK